MFEEQRQTPATFSMADNLKDSNAIIIGTSWTGQDRTGQDRRGKETNQTPVVIEIIVTVIG